ncbi:MAG: sialate O-acetylesterase [Terrimicrobiaceae bacterium]|nr:sialate O-acetylesterase [Terrimicrobiaceae bacterium]
MQLASIFQNHGVLQRDLPLPVWGCGEPGERVIVRLAGNEARTEVDGGGHWLLRLPPLPAGGPHELSVEAPSGRAEVSDLLVGEVWLCSGQSNMEWKLDQCGPDWMADAPDLPQVRLLTVTTPPRLGRAVSVDGSWKRCTPVSLADFSAVGGYFGLELHRALGVPVGLICNACGGSRVQAWTSREALMRDPSGRDEIGFYESIVWQTQGAVRRMTREEWERTGAPQDPGNLGLGRGWAGADFEDAEWPTMPAPGPWQRHGHNHSGVFWFRRTEQVPESWVGRDLELSLGAIDKHDETWVNGERVGSMGWETPDAWCTHRVYPVPGRLIGADRRVVIAVRARSHVYNGGFIGPASAMCLHRSGDASEALPLTGNWRYTVEHDWGMVVPPEPDWGAGNIHSPHILFDNRLAPLVPYGLRGVLWYQGESNAGEAGLYRRMLPLMIQDWRRVWGQGDFPFLQVQLANFGVPSQQPGESRWAELREAQLEILAEPSTGMAVAIDVGEAYNIHPANKRDVGSRLARWALAETYDRGGLPSGPLFSGMKIETGGRVRCSFLHAAGGLVSRGGALRHFTLAGRDRVFHSAEAAIEGGTVVVWSAEAPEPAAVRYAWADNPEGCNLYNTEGLPASSFRSDAWPA